MSIWSILWLLNTTILTLKHYVLIWILTTEKSCLCMSFSCIVNSTFWSWALRFCKVHDVLEVTILSIVSVQLLLYYSLFKLHLLLLSCKHFLLLICQYRMLWCWLFILWCLSWTHHSSNKLITTNHTHTVYLLMTFCRWSLYRIGNRSWVVVSRFCTTSYIAWLYDDTILTWNPWITYWWVMIWLKFAISNTFTIILIWVILQTVQINWIPIGWSSYISRGSHVVLFIL